MRPRPKGPEAKAEVKARGYEAETEAEAKILALRPVWPRGFNISGYEVIFLHISELNNYTGNLLAVVLAHYTHS